MVATSLDSLHRDPLTVSAPASLACSSILFSLVTGSQYKMVPLSRGPPSLGQFLFHKLLQDGVTTFGVVLSTCNCWFTSGLFFFFFYWSPSPLGGQRPCERRPVPISTCFCVHSWQRSPASSLRSLKLWRGIKFRPEDQNGKTWPEVAAALHCWLMSRSVLL